jgi:hypothetical protein
MASSPTMAAGSLTRLGIAYWRSFRAPWMPSSARWLCRRGSGKRAPGYPRIGGCYSGSACISAMLRFAEETSSETA